MCGFLYMLTCSCVVFAGFLYMNLFFADILPSSHFVELLLKLIYPIHILKTYIENVAFLYMFYLVHVRQQVVQVGIDVIIIPAQLHFLHNTNLVELV